jgi:hypothetical protein
MTAGFAWEDEPDRPTRWAKIAAVLRRQPSALLLFVQLSVIMLLPFLEDSTPGRTGLLLLSLAAVVTAVFTVRSTPAFTWLSITLALPAAVLEAWALVDDSPFILTAAHTALALFYFYVAYALVAYMFADFWVTKDELFAVGACFTVLVFAFAYVFLAVQAVWAPSFSSVDGPGQLTTLQLLAFSAANLTSVGLSDIGPIRSESRAVVSIEQLGGVLYVAMVISRLVALTVFRQQR